MDAALGFCGHFLVFIICFATISAVPPDACFANFRWDDCGQPPQPVMYYWKPGSRCEVGMWRGCLPNPNMFHDEYECINTCIFVARARPEDFHSNDDPEEIYPEDSPIESTLDFGNTTDVDGTQATNVTESLGAGNDTTLGDGGGNDASEAATATDAEGGNAETNATPDKENANEENDKKPDGDTNNEDDNKPTDADTNNEDAESEATEAPADGRKRRNS